MQKRRFHDNKILSSRTNKYCSPITSAIVSPSSSFISAYSLYMMPSRKVVLNISISVTVGTVFSLSFNITRNTVAAEWQRKNDRPSRPCYTLLKALRNETYRITEWRQGRFFGSQILAVNYRWAQENVWGMNRSRKVVNMGVSFFLFQFVIRL